MEQSKAKIDNDSVRWATDMAIHRRDSTMRLAVQYATDPDKKERLVEGYCGCCFYRDGEHGRIGGAAMTSRPCGICDQGMMFGSTATDKVCKTCAVANEVCRECGADLRLRPRRQFSK